MNFCSPARERMGVEKSHSSLLPFHILRIMCNKHLPFMRQHIVGGSSKQFKLQAEEDSKEQHPLPWTAIMISNPGPDQNVPTNAAQVWIQNPCGFPYLWDFFSPKELSQVPFLTSSVSSRLTTWVLNIQLETHICGFKSVEVRGWLMAPRRAFSMAKLLFGVSVWLQIPSGLISHRCPAHLVWILVWQIPHCPFWSHYFICLVLFVQCFPESRRHRCIPSGFA